MRLIGIEPTHAAPEATALSTELQTHRLYFTINCGKRQELFQLLLICNLMLQPFPASKPSYKEEAPHSPVSKHSNPYSHGAKSADSDQEDAESDTAGPHGEAGEKHGKFHIAGCSQAIAWNESGCPYQRLYHRNPSHHKQTEGGALCLQACQSRDRP